MKSPDKKALQWLRVARALLTVEPFTAEFQRLARQTVKKAARELKKDRSRRDQRHGRESQCSI